ncbi:MAG: metallophosphoesterase [Flavisolibacter sp.]|nr:metallophosphoesterase [Flavisolibacter sp.]
MKVHVKEYDASQKQAIVNIWNYDAAWKTEYWIDGIGKGSLEQFEGFDPVAYAAMLGPNLPKPRGFAEPKKQTIYSRHLFLFRPKKLKYRQPTGLEKHIQRCIRLRHKTAVTL